MAATYSIPTLEEVLLFADQLELPRPIGNRKVFDVWFLALHEIGHSAVIPKWYRDYSDVIHYDPRPVDAPCAPLAPDLWLLHDPTPNEDCVRLWCLQVCESMGWQNPVFEDVTRFGGRFYNPRQWYMSCRSRTHCEQWLERFGVDVARGQFVSQQDGVKLPHPTGRRLWQILENHNAVYRYFGIDMEAERYDTVHLYFLKHLAAQLNEPVLVAA